MARPHPCPTPQKGHETWDRDHNGRWHGQHEQERSQEELVSFLTLRGMIGGFLEEVAFELCLVCWDYKAGCSS